MTDITRGDLIKIKNREAIYSSEMDMDSEYIVLDIWKHERDVVLKIKKRICDGKDVSFSDQTFTVNGCDVEKVNDKTEMLMDKKEPKFKIGQKVFVAQELVKKYKDVPKGALEITDVLNDGNEEYSYCIKPLEVQKSVVCPYVYEEDWLVSVEIKEVDRGLEKPIKCVEESRQAITPRTVNILGTDYTVVEKHIKGCDGYCDKTTKEIAVATKEDDCYLGNFEEYRKKVLRHEVIHAYHFESGLAENFENKQYGFSETLVDWFAYQSPKIFKTFEELGVL